MANAPTTDTISLPGYTLKLAPPKILVDKDVSVLEAISTRDQFRSTLRQHFEVLNKFFKSYRTELLFVRELLQHAAYIKTQDNEYKKKGFAISVHRSFHQTGPGKPNDDPKAYTRDQPPAYEQIRKLLDIRLAKKGTPAAKGSNPLALTSQGQKNCEDFGTLAAIMWTIFNEDSKTTRPCEVKTDDIIPEKMIAIQPTSVEIDEKNTYDVNTKVTTDHLAAVHGILKNLEKPTTVRLASAGPGGLNGGVPGLNLPAST